MLRYTSSPHAETIQCLSIDDPAALNPMQTYYLELSERYVVALLYFSTNGGGQTKKNLFGQSVCSWDDQSSGESCDGNDSVDSRSFGKLLLNCLATGKMTILSYAPTLGFRSRQQHVWGTPARIEPSLQPSDAGLVF